MSSCYEKISMDVNNITYDIIKYMYETNDHSIKYEIIIRDMSSRVILCNYIITCLLNKYDIEDELYEDLDGEDDETFEKQLIIDGLRNVLNLINRVSREEHNKNITIEMFDNILREGIDFTNKYTTFKNVLVDKRHELKNYKWTFIDVVDKCNKDLTEIGEPIRKLPPIDYTE